MIVNHPWRRSQARCKQELEKLGNTKKGLVPGRAIESYEQQLVTVREIGDRRGEGIALWNMSLAVDKLGDRAQAITHAEAALRIFETIEDRNASKVPAALAQWGGQA
jgi:hypothetical protein